MAVSLDIANAFNILPWHKIRAAMIAHRIPSYLRKIINGYLGKRKITYNVGRNLPLEQRKMERKVPQDSVLGLLLWNLGFDPVLRAAVPDGVEIVEYADDTLIIVGGRS